MKLDQNSQSEVSNIEQELADVIDISVVNNDPVKVDLLTKLLNEIPRVDIREELQLPEDDEIRQKHILVGVVKIILRTAKAKNWGLCRAFDCVYVYNSQMWERLDKEDLKLFLGKCAIRAGFPEYEVLHYEFKDKLFKQFLSDAHLPQPQTDKDRILINLQNGTFEFTKHGWKLREHNPDDFLTYMLPFSYLPDAECPMFKAYLNRVLPDQCSQDVLQEFLGYVFTSLNLEKMLMLTGSGANGKSVFFNIACALFGKQNVLTYSLGLFTHEYNRAQLSNALLNYSSEKGTELNPDTFKALVSGEPLQCRLPYGQPFTLHNKVRFIINANELPKETEQTEAYFRRWLIIPFDVTIPEHERDSELADKIINSELAGVFNWLLIGLNRIVETKKFTFSEKADKALVNFRLQSDSVSLYIDQFGYTPSQTNKEPLAKLYSEYKTFCQDDGYKPVGKQKFSTRLENKKFQKGRGNDGGMVFFIENESKLNF